MTNLESTNDHLLGETIQLRQRVAELEVARDEYRREALEMAEELQQWRTMLEASQDGIVITDYEGCVLKANHTFAKMLGYSVEEVTKLHIWDWDKRLSPDQIHLLSVTSRGKSYLIETEHRRKDGTVFSCQISSNWIIWNNKPASFNIIRDISERKAAENVLKASEARLKKAVELAQLGVWDWDLKTDRAQWFGEMFAILGIKPEDFTGHGQDYTQMTGSVGFEAQNSSERVIVRPDGSQRTILSDSVQLVNELGEPGHMLGIVVDITERKRLQAAQESNQALYDLLVYAMADVIWVLNIPQVRFTYVSPSVVRMRGYTAQEVMEQPLDQALTPESYEKIKVMLAERLPLFMADPTRMLYMVDYIDQPHKAGFIVHTEVNTTLTINQQGELEVIGVSRDISRRVAAAEDARRLQEEKVLLLREIRKRIV